MFEVSKSRFTSRIAEAAGLLTALLCFSVIASCGDDDDPAVTPTTGALNINVTPGTAEVVVTGPNSYSTTFTGNKLLTRLSPGQYSAAATAPGLGDTVAQVNVEAGETSTLFLFLQGGSSTAGSLNVNVSPSNAAVVVTGPDGFSASFVGNQFLTDLAPGQYTATATADGYEQTVGQVNVVVGQTSTLSIAMQRPAPTVGSLNVNVNPSAASVTLTGPANYTRTFTGNEFITDLAPGQYRATATAPGFVDATGSVNVVAGQTSSLALTLEARSIISDSPRAVYRDGSGNLIALDAASIQSGEFVFHAWLDDEPLGLDASRFYATPVANPGDPLISEQSEVAPSFTQNLAGAWVGFRDAAGVIRPVIGADVRWEIDQWWTGRVNSTQFGTSDDNRVGMGFGVYDDQADTRTNNARLANQSYPLLASEYPLFNQTGATSPFIDGFTWVTLFSPDARASSRIVAVATINGEEIGKQILFKRFAPAPVLEITKTVDRDLVNLVNGTATVNFTVTVRNVGSGDATAVEVSDFLASGAGANYALSSLPPGSTIDGDGFDITFPLPGALAPAPPQSSQLLGNAHSFGVLASTGLTNAGPTIISGDVGTSPATAVTGFPPGVILNGSLHTNDALAVSAQGSATTAYTALGARACTGANNLALTSRTLTPGVYCYDATATLAGAIVLDAQGDPNAEFVFKVGSTLSTNAGTSVRLINGASPCNVYWRVGSTATLGANTFFTGNIVAQTGVTVGRGASVSGRIISRTAGVTLDTNAIGAPTGCVAPIASSRTFTFTATVTEPGTYCNGADIVRYADEDQSWTPEDLSAEACFTALESSISIIKDFVADDLTTGLGKTKTVAVNVPAKLRVRVINAGTGNATGVVVNDRLTTANGATYQVTSVSDGTLNTNDGFDTTIGNLAAGATATLFFTVVASADGQYCDTATVTATSGSIAVPTDSACLTVATPNLTISKVNAPDSVLPGSTYTSTIVVTSSGNAPASTVVISDTLGLNAATNGRVVYVSSSAGGIAGTFANNVVTAGAIEIPAGQSRTFTVVSRVPPGAISGQYCNTATVTSSNAATRQASDCIDVPAFSALQTGLVDQNDPIAVGGTTTYFGTLYVEPLSNEGVSSNVITYSFGLSSPTGIGTPGLFEVTTTRIYVDRSPVRDPVTGLVVSDTASPTAVLLVLGTDYTLSPTATGFQVITLTPSFVLTPDSALYIVHTVRVPSGTPANRLYTTSYIWESNGLVNPGTTYEASSSEPTTVLP